MSVLAILILVSVLVATTFLAAFIWAVRSGQYEDTATPAMRVLLEDGVRKRSRAREATPVPVERSAGDSAGTQTHPATIRS